MILKCSSAIPHNLQDHNITTISEENIKAVIENTPMLDFNKSPRIFSLSICLA
jgi:hypothetical protein